VSVASGRPLHEGRITTALLGSSVALLVLGLVGCSKQGSTNTSEGAATVSASVTPPHAPSPAPSASASAAGSVAAPGQASAPPRAAITSRCCRIEPKEGKYGPDPGIHTSYSADIVTRLDGGRFLGNEDIVTDTAELLDYAKGMKRSLQQKRRITIIGETIQYVSLSIEDVGDTGSGTTAKHSGCKTLRIATALPVAPDAALTAEGAARVVAEGRQRVAAADGKFRFGVLSWALLDAGKMVRFCAPEEGDTGARFDVDIPLQEGEFKGK
jgi:hypothetical protein